MELGQIAKMTQTQCHDYYHNTWKLQFYDSFSEYRGEIKELAKTAVHLPPAEAKSYIRNAFLQLHPNNNFCLHAVQQAIAVILHRETVQFRKNEVVVLSGNELEWITKQVLAAKDPKLE